ncbi:GSCOCG00009671001-RA-CDS, partial [Cotesia congregata]
IRILSCFFNNPPPISLNRVEFFIFKRQLSAYTFITEHGFQIYPQPLYIDPSG